MKTKIKDAAMVVGAMFLMAGMGVVVVAASILAIYATVVVIKLAYLLIASAWVSV